MEVEKRDALQNRVYYAFAAVQVTPGVLLLAFLLGSVVLSGGQVTPGGSYWGWWDVVVPFPLFVVPDWLSISLAIVAAVLLVPLVVLTRAAHIGVLVAVFAYSGLAALSNVFFAFAFDPAAGTLHGLHWVAAVIAGCCGVIGLIRLLILNPEYERLRKAGELPNGRLL